MKEKGIKILFSIFLFASVLMPFSVYADTTVPVVYNSQSTQTQWSSHLHVTNYCESPLQGSTPCKLTFTLDDNYYGMIGFDGYAGNTLALNYVTVFVAGGVGEYNYRTFSNANPMYINSVNIMGVGLTIPDSSVDLTLIEQLLTSINSYEQSMDNSMSQILDAMLKQNVSVDSFPSFLYFFNSQYFNADQSETMYYQLQQPDYFNLPYPFIKIGLGTSTSGWMQLQSTFGIYGNEVSNQPHELIFIGWFVSSMNINDSNWNQYFYCSNSSYFDMSFQKLSGNVGYFFHNGEIRYLSLLKFSIKPNFTTGSKNTALRMYSILGDSHDYCYISPVFSGTDILALQTGTDFAIRYGLTNTLLQDLHIIAQGTNDSNSAASGLDQNTNQMQSDFNSYYSIENSANSDFNSALNGINFNDQIAGNQSFLDSASFVKTVFSSMMQIPILSTFVIILCIVLMARIFL